MSPAGEPGATILVVDDEPALLGLVGAMLWRAGYQVLAASGPSEALRISADHPAPIRLLLTDIRMPEMNGYELAESLKTIRPEAKVLYMSGYTDSVLQADTGRLVGDAPLIRKPFTQHKLITKVAELLGDAAASA